MSFKLFSGVDVSMVVFMRLEVMFLIIFEEY